MSAATAAGRFGGGRITLLATDGERVAGVVAAGEPLHLAERDDGVLLASEPHDDGVWRRLADGAVVEAGPDGVSETHL